MRERPAFVRAPASIRAAILLLAALLAIFACAGASLGLTLALAPQRLDLVHLAVFNVCQMRGNAWHWQNTQRLPTLLRYDFTISPDSFILLEVWVHNGPTLSLSQRIPLPCG